MYQLTRAVVKTIEIVFFVLLFYILWSGVAHAAGSGMPWEGPLNRILQSIEGPVARIAAVIIIIITGLALAFGESSGGMRNLIRIVFGLSIAFAATSFFLTFFSFGGGATLLFSGAIRWKATRYHFTDP